jgi:hypothetical protein
MRVRPTGDARDAVVRVDTDADAVVIECDVLVVGGGTGGTAAAWAAARLGRSVHVIEETDWLGGQFTAQGVSALDEHQHIVRFGGTRTYERLCAEIRDHYRGALRRPEASPPVFNPGNCWVTRLAFEPRVAVKVLDRLLAPHVQAGHLRIRYRTKAIACTVQSDRITEVLAASLDNGGPIRFRPTMVIDATELGDLLPLAGAEYVVGAESVAETGEAHAQPNEAKPQCVQSFTYTFAAELRPVGERHVLPMPKQYESFRDSQPYALRIHVSGGEIYSEDSGWLEYEVFDKAPGTKGSLWEYRRLIDHSQFGDAFPADISMFNWPGSDYRATSILDRSPAQIADALQQAKRVGLGFLHWLQTEAPEHGRAHGFPQIILRPDVMGTPDGLSKHPYIRESRRIRARKTIVEQEVSAETHLGPRAAHFADSVGVGWYPIDIHRSGPEDVGASCRTKPFQIALGALIPVRIENLLAASKNIGTTHVTNGCYRLHPVEWNIGESAGALAAFAIESRRTPAQIHADPGVLRSFQRVLLREGVPLYWLIDVPVAHPGFAAVQDLALSVRPDAMTFDPAATLRDEERIEWSERVRRSGLALPELAEARTRLDFAVRLTQGAH